MDNNYSGLIYDKQSVEHAISILTESRTDLFEADNEIYEAIKDLTNANGFHLIEIEAGGMDVKLPEKVINNLR